MKKLSEYKDDEALDLLADIVEPAAAIFADKNVKEAFRSDNKFKAAKAIIKTHKKEIIEILARLNNTPVEEYHCNIFTLPAVILQILQDQELVDFFSSAVGAEDVNASFELTANTEETEEK